MQFDDWVSLEVIAIVAGVLLGIYLYEYLRKPSQTLKYHPRGDRVIVKRLDPPQPKEGELFSPDSQQKPLNSGKVIAVGPGVKGLSPGDTVDFFDYANVIEIEGQEYLLLRDQEIWGKHGS